MLDAQTAQFEQEAIVRNARFQKEMMAEIENAGGRSRSAMSRERARHGSGEGTV